MKRTQLEAIKNLEIKDLRLKIKEVRDELASLTLDRTQAAKGSKDVKAVFKKRKEIAKMLTILRQKQLLMELESKDRSHLPGDNTNSPSHLEGGRKEAKV